MKFKFQLVLAMLACGSLRAEVEDVQLRQVLDRAVRYIDNPYASWAEIEYAIRLTGGNTNRVVSLMRQLVDAGTEDAETSMFYLCEIGKYGTINDLPFLYQRVADSNLCDSAVRAIVQISTVSTDVVNQVCGRLKRGPASDRNIASAWTDLAFGVHKKNADQDARNIMVSNLVEYASRQYVYPERIDRSVIRLDPSYRQSKRRLSVLRAVQDLGVNEWQTNFVTTAIRELEAYPEADLPE